jgi:hypothetical protein
VVIQVEGHSGERGTAEYNIALGRRRAEVVQHFDWKGAGMVTLLNGIGVAILATLAMMWGLSAYQAWRNWRAGLDRDLAPPRPFGVVAPSRGASLAPRSLRPTRCVEQLLGLPWIRLTPAVRTTQVGWLALAVLSIGSVWWSVLRFGASVDYWWVRVWLDTWQFGAHNPYQIQPAMDYPPWALVVLAPLAWLGPPPAERVFLGINTTVALLGTWQCVRWTEEIAGARLNRAEVMTLSAMLLSTRALRHALIIGNTMPLALLLFMLAMRLASRRPWLSGACFALASFKLNLAVGFGVALLVLGNTAALTAGFAVTIGLFAVTTAMSHLSPMALIVDYAHSLLGVYGGVGFTRGDTDVRSLIAALTSNVRVVHVSSAAFAAVSGVGVACTVRAAKLRSTNAAIVAYAVFLWTLLLLPDQSYNMIFVMPALWLIHWPETRLIRTAGLRWACAMAGLIYFIPSVPFAMEQYWETRWHSVFGGTLDALWPHRARLLVAGLFALLVARCWNMAQPACRTATSQETGA